MTKLVPMLMLTALLLMQTAHAQSGQRPPVKGGNYDPTIEDSLRTMTLTRLALGLKDLALKPARLRQTMKLLRATDGKVGAILADSALTDSKKQKQVALALSDGTRKIGAVLGKADTKRLHDTFGALSGPAFNTRLQAIAGPKFSQIQRKLMAAEPLGGGADPFTGDWYRPVLTSPHGKIFMAGRQDQIGRAARTFVTR